MTLFAARDSAYFERMFYFANFAFFNRKNSHEFVFVFFSAFFPHNRPQEVQQLELFCKQFYECTDQQLRSKAEKILFEFLDDPDALTKCQILLDRGDSPYSQLLAATTLTKLISRNVQGLSLQQRVDIR
jgi:hypothetical protein